MTQSIIVSYRKSGGFNSYKIDLKDYKDETIQRAIVGRYYLGEGFCILKKQTGRIEAEYKKYGNNYRKTF